MFLIFESNHLFIENEELVIRTIDDIFYHFHYDLHHFDNLVRLVDILNHLEQFLHSRLVEFVHACERALTLLRLAVLEASFETHDVVLRVEL